MNNINTNLTKFYINVKWVNPANNSFNQSDFIIINPATAKLSGSIKTGSAVDGISFTGSSTIGKAIVNVSSQFLKQLTLELGGKSANPIKNSRFDLEYRT